MKKVDDPYNRVLLILDNVMHMLTAVVIFLIALGIAGMAFSALFGIGIKINTDPPLWSLVLVMSIIVLVWSSISAVLSWLSGSIANDLSEDYGNLNYVVAKIAKALFRIASWVLYPALLFWKGVIFIFRSKIFNTRFF